MKYLGGLVGLLLPAVLIAQQNSGPTRHSTFLFGAGITRLTRAPGCPSCSGSQATGLGIVAGVEWAVHQLFAVGLHGRLTYTDALTHKGAFITAGVIGPQGTSPLWIRAGTGVVFEPRSCPLALAVSARREDPALFLPDGQSDVTIQGSCGSVAQFGATVSAGLQWSVRHGVRLGPDFFWMGPVQRNDTHHSWGAGLLVSMAR